LGSNAARLAVFAYDPGRQFQLVDELREPLRLTSETGSGNVIRGDALERGLTVLAAFRTYCDATGIEEIRAVATSGVRNAANGETFITAARDQARIDLRVLTGEEEAAYGAVAVANSQAFHDAMVFDLGGGSAQVSRLRARRFDRGASWPIGTVRMTQAFLGEDDPPKKKQIRGLVELVRSAAAELAEWPDGVPMVGMGGTIRNLALMDQLAQRYPVRVLHGYVLRRSSVDDLAERLLEADTEQRREIPGLSPERVDVIAAGAVVVREILRLARVDELVVSGQGLREGMLYERLLPGASPPLVPDVREFAVANVMRRYYDHPTHNQQVRVLSLQLFDQLAPLHEYGPFERDLLGAAALLHDIGMAVEYHEHHSHGMHLVMSGPLPGFTHREQALVAVLVGAHRKGKPNPESLKDLYASGDEERVQRLGGMLRLAEYLDRSQANRVARLHCLLDEGYVQVQVIPDGDATVEISAARRRLDLLARALRVKIEVVLG
jgi:exopolyphosphatase/guanosine-5'-triphosphate,3'-diphosphate pyrophosphatase